MKTVSVIVPAYNEEDCISELCERLKLVFSSEVMYRWDVIVIENGSTDSTWNKLQDIAMKDERFKILKLSRNFRMDGGLTAGLNYVNSDFFELKTILDSNPAARAKAKHVFPQASTATDLVDVQAKRRKNVDNL
jgi:glycosyltransferase involved in cell wall biosynthesis